MISFSMPASLKQPFTLKDCVAAVSLSASVASPVPLALDLAPVRTVAAAAYPAEAAGLPHSGYAVAHTAVAHMVVAHMVVAHRAVAHFPRIIIVPVLRVSS